MGKLPLTSKTVGLFITSPKREALSPSLSPLPRPLLLRASVLTLVNSLRFLRLPPPRGLDLESWPLAPPASPQSAEPPLVPRTRDPGNEFPLQLLPGQTNMLSWATNLHGAPSRVPPPLVPHQSSLPRSRSVSPRPRTLSALPIAARFRCSGTAWRR